MLIHKKAVSVILLILGLSFSGSSYANAENSFDDESNVIMDALNSGVDGFRSYTTLYNFTWAKKGESAYYPGSALVEIGVAFALYGINKTLHHAIYLDDAFGKFRLTGKVIKVNQVIKNGKLLTLSEPFSMVGGDGKIRTAQKVRKTQKLSQAQLDEYVKQAKGPLTFRALNIASGVLLIHAGLITLDTVYLAFTN